MVNWKISTYGAEEERHEGRGVAGGAEGSLTKRLQEATFSVEGWFSVLMVFLLTKSSMRNVNSETTSKRPHATQEPEL